MREVLYCPGCQRRLHLPDDAMGKTVQCPSCQRVFIAEPKLTASPITTPTTKPTPSAPAPARTYDDGDDRAARRRHDDDDDFDRPRSRRAAAHRGGEILTFGLLALLPCFLTSIIFGIIAWMMANADLGEMRSGRMDRDGEGLTQAGRALGIVGLFLWTGIYLCGCLFNARRF